jgi:hypothetical protein
LDSFITQGPFSVAPCQTLVSRFATFASLTSIQVAWAGAHLLASASDRDSMVRAFAPVLASERGEKLRIVTLFGWERSLTGPLRDARRFRSTRWYPVPGATRTTLGFGICPSFKGPIAVQTFELRFAIFASLYTLERAVVAAGDGEEEGAAPEGRERERRVRERVRELIG